MAASFQQFKRKTIFRKLPNNHHAQSKSRGAHTIMYSYKWDPYTHGYVLTTATGSFVANELRPVFAEELLFYNFQDRLIFDRNETSPLLWAQRNNLFYNGEKIISLDKIEYGKPISATFFFNGKKKLAPLKTPAWIKRNNEILDALVFDTLKRIKEMYDQNDKKCGIKYIAFSGGKDSMLLLDLCHRVLPLTVPVVFSDTDMELPDTYRVWTRVQNDKRYNGRPFIKVKAGRSALENWQLFGPPSRVLRWCCSVHKSAPAILALKEFSGNPYAKLLAFVGVRGDESLRRSEYDDIGEGKKSSSQIQAMPILDWSSHELWLYTFREKLIVNDAYRKGVHRVGCIFCPQSGERLMRFVQLHYPKETKMYADAIIQSSNRQFASEDDAEMFVFHGGWQARKSGVLLNNEIEKPIVEVNCNKVTFILPTQHTDDLKEWLKAIGVIVQLKNKEWQLQRDGQILNFDIITTKTGKQVSFTFQKSFPDKKLLGFLSLAMNKVLACVGCNSCKANCPAGAISFHPTVKIDAHKCIHCLKCYNAEKGCFRFDSKRGIKGISMDSSGFHKYKNFGLKPEWIARLSDFGEEFRSKFGAGLPMITSAVAWFREAGLIEKDSTLKTTKLLTIGEKNGFADTFFWQLIWMQITNNSALVKWYNSVSKVGQSMTRAELDVLVAKIESSPSNQKGALSSLFSLFKNSPLGVGKNPVARVESKGNQVKSLTRMPVEPEPLAVLYGLYLAGSHANRNAFTIREMQQTDFQIPSVSPMAAFGLSRDSFIQIVNGLAARYPAFISGTFTHGLDEVRLFSEEKTLDDVIELIMNGAQHR